MREFHLNFPPAFNEFLTVHSLHSFDCGFLVVKSNEAKFVFHLNMHYLSKWLESIKEIFLAYATIKRSNIDLALFFTSIVTTIPVLRT